MSWSWRLNLIKCTLGLPALRRPGLVHVALHVAQRSSRWGPAPAFEQQRGRELWRRSSPARRAPKRTEPEACLLLESSGCSTSWSAEAQTAKRPGNPACGAFEEPWVVPGLSAP